nr:MAG TPA: hypothetical protein [Caudoviricetes sp.]
MCVACLYSTFSTNPHRRQHMSEYDLNIPQEHAPSDDFDWEDVYGY